jgi:hypothetical protein
MFRLKLRMTSGMLLLRARARLSQAFKFRKILAIEYQTQC